MTDQFILALDQGTTSSRAIVFDANGQILGKAQREFEQHYPQPGWVEHDPLEIWETQLSTLREAINTASLQPSQLAAIGVTNQRETIVIWDRDSGEPIHNAIVWQDRRTADQCQALKSQGVEPDFRQRTGLCLDPYFSGTKVQWLLDNVSGARPLAEAGRLLCGTIDSWLIWKLTGGAHHVTDVTNASRTLLCNIHTLEWDDELLGLLHVPRAILPKIRSSSERIAAVSSDILPGDIPIAGIAGDQQAALFGQACFDRGMAKNTYGTGCFLLMNVGDQPVMSSNNLLTTVAWRIGNRTDYALEGSVFIGGAVIQWLRDELQLIQSASECDELAATVDNANGVILVPAFAGLGAPHWDPYARGGMSGITRGTNRAHLCHAALDAIALQSCDLMDAMNRDAGCSIEELRVDGGASRSDPLMQMQADYQHIPVVRSACSETTALGAAYLAGLAVGVWNSREQIEQQWHEARRFQPSRDASAISELRNDWNRAVERSKSWAGGVE